MRLSLAAAALTTVAVSSTGIAAGAAPTTAEPIAHERIVTAPTARDSTTAPTAARAAAAGIRRFVREAVRRGDRDASPSDIDHVRELQYRLTWAGAYHGSITGYFGDRTRAAVQRYQRRLHMPSTGVAGAATWRRLIPATIRGRSDVPTACSAGTGWDACYDRTRHEVTVWHDGELINAWLVRGGGADTPTRTGDFTVYYRDIDHVSGTFGSPMPYSQFFSGGEAFHGSATMVDPFTGHSHGCINMYAEDAAQLWALTSRTPLAVHVRGAWS